MKKKQKIKNEFERNILYGLSMEWEHILALVGIQGVMPMRKPMFALKDMQSRLGYWSGRKKEIVLQRDFVFSHPWDAVLDVLRHEMAHQYAEEVLGAKNEPPHGRSFQKACYMLRANPRASGNYAPLHERIANEKGSSRDRMTIRIKKLMALAESCNQHEAESAMLKAYELMARYKIDQLNMDEKRNFYTVFCGKPALRHFREVYELANLIRLYYFVEAIWVPAFVKEKNKMGKVLEISGTPEDVMNAGYVFDFVNHHIDSRWKSYNDGKGMNRYRKTDFALGIIRGFMEKLEEGVKNHMETEKGFALVVQEDAKLNEYFHYRYPRTTRISKKALMVDPEVMEEGIREGRKMVISKGISQRETNGKGLLPE